jgi:protein-disulfide isomerase
MEENTIQNIVENKAEKQDISKKDDNSKKSQAQIAGAIIIAGVLIAGAILLKGNMGGGNITDNSIGNITLAKIGPEDRTMGNPKAKVAVVLYEDFQCPFCGAISGLEADTPLILALKQRDPSWTPFMLAVNEYVKENKVLFVYRDWAFLGAESQQAAEAARCAGDQGKFWEYHDYLYSHQNGENEGAFSDPNLKSFAKVLNLDTATFNECLIGDKYMQAVIDSKNDGSTAGVSGTPKGFILKNGKVVSLIEGAEGGTTVKIKIEKALK